MNRVRTTILLLALLWGVASAAVPSLPPDARLMITDPRGVIVGVGHITGGTAFEMTLLTGFEGRARLTLLLDDGRTEAFEVVVVEGTVRVDGVDLLDLLPATVEHVTVHFETAAEATNGNGPPGGPADDVPGRGPPDDVPGRGPPDAPPGGDGPGRGPPEDAPGRGPDGGADDDGSGRGPPSTPPGRR